MTSPYYADDTVTLWHGDCLDVMRELPDASVDAIVTDPPYGLGFMGREWDDLPPGLPWATECLRVLKPGGHLLAFGGTRTWHRLACVVEDAGFEVRDSIAWLYGSGFPKSLDVSKAIDKLDAADERLKRARAFQAWLRPLLTPQQINAATGTDMGHHLTTHPTQPTVATADLFDKLRSLLPPVPAEIEALVTQRTVESENFKRRAVVGSARMVDATASRLGFAGATYGGDGSMREVDLTDAHTDDARTWQGWGTALKPAFEPVVVARKPLIGTVAANVLTHGTGALNVDACRVQYASDADLESTRSRNQHGDLGHTPSNEVYGTYTKPLVNYDGSKGRWPANVVLDGSQADALDTQSGDRPGFSTQRDLADRAGTDGTTTYGAGVGALKAGTRVGFNDSGGASRFFPAFRYEAKAPTAERPRDGEVAHPTVKPLDLMRWLVRLVTPPGGVVLDPFAGSGTTAEACVVEGFRCVTIEREADYLPLIVARLSKPIELAMFGDSA